MCSSVLGGTTGSAGVTGATGVSVLPPVVVPSVGVVSSFPGVTVCVVSSVPG